MWIWDKCALVNFVVCKFANIFNTKNKFIRYEINVHAHLSIEMSQLRAVLLLEYWVQKTIFCYVNLGELHTWWESVQVLQIGYNLNFVWRNTRHYHDAFFIALQITWMCIFHRAGSFNAPLIPAQHYFITTLSPKQIRIIRFVCWYVCILKHF